MGKTKKVKIDKQEVPTSSTTTGDPQTNVHPQLQISVLTWVGHPTTCCGDGDALDQYVGQYKSAVSSTLDLQGWNDLHKAFEYRPSHGTIGFRYIRETFVDIASSSITYHGAILADGMSPKIRVCALGQNPWPDKIETDPDMVNYILPYFLYI